MKQLFSLLSQPWPWLAAVTLLSTVALQAADPLPEPPRRPAPPPGGPPGQRFLAGPPNRGGGLQVERILNEEQRQQFREELQTQRARLREYDEKSMTLRREFEDALFAEKLDEKVVREKAAALAEIDADRALVRAGAFAKIRPSLSEEQLERLKTLRAESTRPMGPGPGLRRPRDGAPPPGDGPDRRQPPRRPPGEQPGEADPLPPPRPPAPPR